MHHIRMEEGAKANRYSQRKLNPNMREEVMKEVLKLLSLGIIYSIPDSEWVSPVHMVPKKSGIQVVTNDRNELVPTSLVTGWRMCIDYLKLNAAIRKDHCPLPFIDQMLERRMPFGLCNAPGTFQRCMMSICSDILKECIEIFMDDFTVYGDSFEACLHHLDRVDPTKVDVIAKLPYPTNQKKIRGFLGHTCFYRRFIKDFAKIAQPLTRLLQNKVDFDFDQSCKDAFQLLKQKIVTAPIIRSPDWNLPFETMCDASDLAVGAVLARKLTAKITSSSTLQRL
ncbi:hypothetical protein AAHA92_06260 [Salvia divinorum]|uniref:Retrovirus-related Pol polyprotein from transposon 17.6 n=1 Tax=Salvia divinorum TaxID=28513 RepID=A0ABD1I656_SALDI